MKKILGVTLSLIAVYIVVVFVSAFQRIEKFSMPTSYMEPTISAGTNVLADMKAYDKESPERFDLVVFLAPDRYFAPQGTEKKKTILCMRVIGLPGEKIEIKENVVYVNSQAIELPEALNYTTQGPVTLINLSLDEYFLLGDNSPISFDSRYWGSVERENILGEIIKI